MCLRTTSIVAAWLLAGPALAAGVTARRGAPPPDLEVVVPSVELRWSSTGRLLGTLRQGAPLDRLGGRGGWTRAGVHGWMRAADLVRAGEKWAVAVERGELARSAAGPAMGSLVRGVEVTRVGDRGEWYEIELIGWLPDSTVAEHAPSAAPVDSTPAPARADSSVARSFAPPTARAGMARTADGVELRSAPEGSVVTRLPAGAVVESHEARGGWTRVTVEGWVPSAAVRLTSGGTPTPADVAAAPDDRFAGRPVEWSLELVALQEAGPYRSDFDPGERFALARVPDGGGATVYVVLPPSLVPVVQGLSAFQPIRVTGRLRTGHSSLTGAPIVDASEVVP